MKFILGPIGSGFVPSWSKNLKTMEHSDSQLPIIRVFQYFKVLLFLHLVLLGFVGVTRSFLYLFLRTGLASTSSPQDSRPTDYAESPEQLADPEDSTKPHLFFLHPHPCAVADVSICWCWCFSHCTQVAAHSSRALSMLPLRGANQIRTGRSGDNRLLTCLEAQEAGYSFVRNCSKCDYYLQNKALNMKAQTLPRSQLSKMWQCTDVHKFSNLYHSHCTNTPYKAVSPKKSNSYICSTRSSILSPARKRTRLFDTTPSTVENNPSASITPANEPYHCNVSSLLRDLKNAECQRDLAMNDRDVAFLERDRAFMERDELRALNASYIELRDAAYSKSDSVKAECYRLIMQRDQAMEENDLLIAENNNNVQKLAAVESEFSILRRVVMMKSNNY